MNQDNNLAANKMITVDPPAAHVCRACGHVEKVEKIMLVSRQPDTCEECGSRNLAIDSWERASK